MKPYGFQNTTLIRYLLKVIAAIALPGYWLSILLIDVIGRRPIQFLGFAFIAVVFASMGLFYDQLKQIGPLFVVCRH